MKRTICLITALCLIFGSFSFTFAADWSQTDINSVVNNVSSINTTLNNIYNRLGTISNALFDSNHSIAYWVSAIDSWLQPIYQSLTSNLAVNLGLDPIINGLNYVNDLGEGTIQYVPRLVNIQTGLDVSNQLIQNLYNISSSYFSVNNQLLSELKYDLTNGYSSTQNVVNWGNLGTSTFTPVSSTDGIYKYLSAIQAPVARLSYVLASDERIEAQQAAAANEEAVVDNFIDSSGSGATSTSDISSISDLSSGYKSNFGSNASVTGIFNIFNSNNMGWFSSETYNQLDTTSNNRRTKSDSLPDTPLLDQKINNIYEAIGLDNDR